MRVWKAACVLFWALVFSLAADAQIGGPVLGGGSFITGAGTIPSGKPILPPDGNATAPPYAFSAAPGTGLFRASNGQPTFVAGSSIEQAGVDQNGGWTILNGGFLTWRAGTQAGSADDLFLTRDAANTLRQSNGTNAQKWILAFTRTDASNFEWLEFGFNGSTGTIAHNNAGTGAARSISINGAALQFRTGGGGIAGGTARWDIAAGGTLTASTDNSWDIGAAGATRPRTGYYGTSVVAPRYDTTNLLISGAAPTISSGFGTSPSISANNGTAAFRVNVGTGGAATTGVVGLPTATTGWNCTCTDITTASTTVFLCKQTASSTTTATIGNFNTAGAAAAWVASDIVAMSCFAL